MEWGGVLGRVVSEVVVGVEVEVGEDGWGVVCVGVV